MSGSAAQNLATNPYAQRVGRNYAANAAQGAAQKAKSGIIELKLYVEENPTSLRVALLVGATLLALFSFIGFISVFAVFKPGQLLINLYNFIFAIIIIILEGKEGWCGGMQRRLYEKAAFLGSGCGKGGFILWVGTMIFCVDLEYASTFWSVMYILLGILFCGLGLMQIQQSTCPGCCPGGNRDGQGHARFNDDAGGAPAGAPQPGLGSRPSALSAERPGGNSV